MGGGSLEQASEDKGETGDAIFQANKGTSAAAPRLRLQGWGTASHHRCVRLQSTRQVSLPRTNTPYMFVIRYIMFPAPPPHKVLFSLLLLNSL